MPDRHELIAPTLTQRYVASFGQLLAACRSSLAPDPSLREHFESTANAMSAVYHSHDGDATAGSDTPPVHLFPADDNLDTGNAWQPPPPSYRDQLAQQLQDPETLRGYQVPRPLEVLNRATLLFLRRRSYVSKTPAARYGIVVGAGTVHLYDTVVRRLVQRRGDTLLVPAVTYGFFLPQIDRAGGQVCMIEPHRRAGTLITARKLASTIDAVNARLLDSWKQEAGLRLELFWLQVHRQAIPRSLSRALVAAARAAASHAEADRCLERMVESAHLLRGGERRALMALVSPPRVVGLLHINPNVSGAVYQRPLVEDLASVLKARRVAVIEDLAYDGLRLRGRARVASFLRTGARVFSLIGFSKTFSLAGDRIGLLAAALDDLPQLRRLVESSVGFAPTAQQRALAALLLDHQQITSYQAAATDDPREGYKLKRLIMLAVLEGTGSPRLPPRRRAQVTQRIVRELRAFADARMRQLGASDILAGSAGATRLSGFLAGGVRRWLRITHDPEMGMFVIVNCAPTLRSPLGRRLGLRSSFDVFALLAYFFGIRSIPEEALSAPGSPATRLRLSLSPPVQRIVWSLFLTCAGLAELDRLVSGPRRRAPVLPAN